MKRRQPAPPPPTITWTARGGGWASLDGRFTVTKPRETWVLTDTRGPEILREQAAPSPEAAKRRAEQILNGEALPKDP